ncbi:uncharacterized protein [Dysidea avara]|uniref:uncharacterized protein n=1 Tax=Dysidea avara TaxID=196820 RepID=UPI00332D5DE8
MTLNCYNIIDGTAIDYMHCVLLGITKLLLSLWFSSEHSRDQFYIGRSASRVDKRLEEIQPPSCITRKPRSISKHMKYFKASEFKSFLLYYSLPLLSGILPQQYWDHHALLVIAIYNLLQHSVSPHQLDLCQTLLTKHCYQFSRLYSERYMTANVHLLLHLPDNVRQLGPLWAYSCFSFEGQNGILKNLVHGTQQVDKQIISTYSYIRSLLLAAANFSDRTCEQHFEAFKQLYFKHNMPEQRCKVLENVYLLGKPTRTNVTETELLALSTYGLNQTCKYLRIIFHGFQIQSFQWKINVQKRNNSAVAYRPDRGGLEYGLVQGFFVVEEGSSPKVYVTLTKLLKHDSVQLQMQSHPHWQIPHITACVPPTSSSLTIAIPLEHILSPCVYISFSDVQCVYLAIIVNLLEKD